MAARPRHRHAALRQPQDRRGRRLHRLAGRGHRRAQACARRAGAGRGGLPGGARRRGGVRLRPRRPSRPIAQLKAATGPIAAAYFDAPTEQLDVLAVTGTNGKTSTAWWLAQALSNLEPQAVPCGLIGTLGTGRPPHVEFVGLTTPDPVLLQRQFRRFLDEGLKACAIEASSVGIVERRLDGTRIRVAVFTNFTQDHLDYHGNDGGLLGGQGRAVPLAGPAGGRRQPGRREGAGACAVAARRRDRPVDRLLRGAGAADGPRHRLRRPGPALRGAGGRRAAPAGHPA